jgi:hypothetical protein
MSDEPYIKLGEDGQEQRSLLNEENCIAITRNFATSPDNLPCTLGHQPNTMEKARYKTATYSAMVTWKDGRVLEMGAHDPVAPPLEADLPRADNGAAPESGNYVFRATATPLGEAIVKSRAVSKTSPEFVMIGFDQQAREIGPQALGLAWTDDPFLKGCEINMERRPAFKAECVRLGVSIPERTFTENPMPKNHLMEAAGATEQDSDAEKLKKMTAHYGRRAMESAGVKDGDEPKGAVEKFTRHMESESDAEMGRRKHKMARAFEAEMKRMEGGAEPDADNVIPQHIMGALDPDIMAEMRRKFASGELRDGPGAMEAYKAHHYVKHGKHFEFEDPILQKGAPTRVNEPPTNNAVVGGHDMERGSRGTIDALSARVQDQDRRLQEYESREQRRAQAEDHRAATDAVAEAWGRGQIVKRLGESDDAARKRFVALYTAGKQNFENALAPPGTEKTLEQTKGRLTQAGLPAGLAAALNFERSNASAEEQGRPDEVTIRLIDKRIADPTKPRVSRLDACKEIFMERRDYMNRPGELEQAYRAQSKAALFQ